MEMNKINQPAVARKAAGARHRPAIGAGLLSISLAALAMTLPAAGASTDAQMTTKRAASVAIVTTRDFRVAVVAQRLDGGAAPTAEVRVAVAQRVASRWRERGETRLNETYFWRTITGPRAVCKLDVATATSPRGARPHVAVQLLRSPSLGCGPTHRIPLPDR